MVVPTVTRDLISILMVSIAARGRHRSQVSLKVRIALSHASITSGRDQRFYIFEFRVLEVEGLGRHGLRVVYHLGIDLSLHYLGCGWSVVSRVVFVDGGCGMLMATVVSTLGKFRGIKRVHLFLFQI